CVDSQKSRYGHLCILISSSSGDIVARRFRDFFRLELSGFPLNSLVPYGTNSRAQVWYHLVPMSSGKKMATTRSKRRHASGKEIEARERILDAAFAAFMQNGYAATSTLEIATRARVSKRELYSLVGNKEKMLAACIMERARRLRVAADLPIPRDREALMDVLAGFGTQLLREVTDP